MSLINCPEKKPINPVTSLNNYSMMSVMTTKLFRWATFVAIVTVLHVYSPKVNGNSNACWVFEPAIVKQFVTEAYGMDRAPVISQWQRMLDSLETQSEREKLNTVNNFFHANLRYRTDFSAHGVEDFWTTPLETLGQGFGDCEDYAIAKYISLRIAGVPSNKLRLIYVRAQIGGPNSTVSQAHMVLGYFESTTAEPLILDSLIRNILPASERDDLTPVFSFNSEGLWAGAAGSRSSSSPTSRLSRWRNVLERMETQGVYLEKQ